MKSKQSTNTLVTLANGSELVAGIASKIIGNEVADTFNGSNITRGMLHQLAQTKFQSSISNVIGSK